jgi:hypothetical protein
MTVLSDLLICLMVEEGGSHEDAELTKSQTGDKARGGLHGHAVVE